MDAQARPIGLKTMRAEKLAVASNSIYAALVITALKIVVGFSTGSLGILSEAAHSGLDLVAAFITWMSVRVSDKPADADHQYGHGKVENFSAFLETGLLLLTCVWIVWEAVRRLRGSAHIHLEPTAAAFLVMMLSMAIDFWRSRALGRIAKKYDSQALQADALHFSTDVWSSAVVILGLTLVLVGRKTGTEWLSKADPVSALLVAGVIVYVSSRLGRQTLDALLDAAPAGIRSSIATEVMGVKGVLDVDRVRIRKSGNRYFADVSVGLARNLTFQRSEQLSSAVSEAVQRVLPGTDVVVHSLPRAPGGESIFERIKAVASRNNLSVHDVSVQDLGGRLHVEQHLELDENLSLKEAHEQVTSIEAEIRQEVPEIHSILTHIESEPATIETPEQNVQDPGLERSLRKIVKEFPEVLDMHDLILKRLGDRLYLSCHCTMPDDLPLSRVHDVSTAMEIRFKQQAPQLFKVLIHTEPQTDNTR